MNDIPRGTTISKLINSLQMPQHLAGEQDPSTIQPDVQFSCEITDSRLDDELSVAVVKFIRPPTWLRHLDLDPFGFPKKTHLGTLWKAVNTTERDQDGQTEFMRAAIADDLLYAEALAEYESVDINVQDNRGRTALHWASVGRLSEIVMLCLSVLDCNVGLRDENNLTAFDLALLADDDLIPNLFYQNVLELETTDLQSSLLRVLTITSEPAEDLPIFPGSAMFDPVRDGNEALVAALIERGVDLTARNEDGDTALLIASSQARNAVIAEMLLDAGSDINATGATGATALHNAEQSADPEMVEMLLQRMSKDLDGCTPLNRAEQNREYDSAQILQNSIAEAAGRERNLQVARVEETRRPTRTALHEAAENGDTKHVLGLLASGADINEVGWGRRTPLFLAVEHRKTETALALLARGADCNLVNYGRKSVLHVAAGYGDIEILTALLRNGADIQAVDINGQTALNYAAGSREKKVFEVLLRKGANFDAVDSMGMTALHSAVEHNNRQLVEALLARGAGITANYYTEIPLEMALGSGQTDIVEILPASESRFPSVRRLEYTIRRKLGINE